MEFISSLKILKRIVALVGFFLLINAYRSSATHLRAGEITVVRSNCNSLAFDITVRAFTNTKNTNVLFGGDNTAILDFGDKSPVVLVPTIPNTIRYDLAPDGSIAMAEYTAYGHVFPGYGQYLISYKEPNRNQGVLNMDNSVNTEFYIETYISVDPFFGCDNSPQLSVPPIDRGCVGVAWFHNPGAFDPDGDSLSYELVIPFQDRNLTVTNYKDPADRKFYTNYNTANEAATGPPSFKIDPRDGTITWDAPGAVGEYNVAFIVREWRKINGDWIKMGYVRRDMQIIIDDCKNHRPDLIIPKDTCVEAGTILKAKIKGIDQDNDKVKIEVFSEILNLAPAQSPATFTPNPPAFAPQPLELDFTWNTTCEHIKEQPYQVVFKITDQGSSTSHLVTFKTWFIKVVGPAPKWTKAELTLPKRNADLEWESYKCQNAQTMQIWRRTNKVDFVPDNCETGMPPFLGYTLIDQVPIKDANNIPFDKYQDTNGGKGLARGATYCYRLVAVFPLPRGGQSYVSKDTCIGPILADAPIITNVTVDKTGTADGKITVRWRKPFDVNTVQFPPPYRYDLYRGIGFAGAPGSTAVYSGIDTTFVDTGLNTENNPYNYTVVLRDGTNAIVDTSAVASSVRLDAQSKLSEIQLNWSAFVPWSNQVQLYPLHDIYRGNEGDTEIQLVLIDNVNVTTRGFLYIDKGQYQNTPLVDGKNYCYRVMTRGAYGNPKINEPLINYSQIMCAQTADSVAPCKPALPIALSQPDCSTYLNDKSTCSVNIVFSNTLIWNRPSDPSCVGDVRSYNVYASSVLTGEYSLIANVEDTVYVDGNSNLPSYARCYKISAIDHSGNESELSDAVCFENCPYYELPNVFTPNGDGCNDKFSAYSDNSRYVETDEHGNKVLPCQISIKDEFKCARFVESVVFHVYNRWGKEVFTYQGRNRDENTIYIDWDGRDSDGVELSSAVYYYLADVTFVAADPAKQHKTIKGWIHLVR